MYEIIYTSLYWRMKSARSFFLFFCCHMLFYYSCCFSERVSNFPEMINKTDRRHSLRKIYEIELGLPPEVKVAYQNSDVFLHACRHNNVPHISPPFPAEYFLRAFHVRNCAEFNWISFVLRVLWFEPSYRIFCFRLPTKSFGLSLLTGSYLQNLLEETYVQNLCVLV